MHGLQKRVQKKTGWRVPADLRVLLRTSGAIGKSIESARGGDAGSDPSTKRQPRARARVGQGQTTHQSGVIDMRGRFAFWLLVSVFAMVSAFSLLGALKFAEWMGWA